MTVKISEVDTQHDYSNPPQRHMKVLIVDDDASTRLLFSRTLQHHGYRAECVDDGLSAWNTLSEEDHLVTNQDRVAIILADWAMPGMDGLELCRRIRNREHTPYVYFILVTGRRRVVANYREAVQAGVDDFLEKPVDTDDLLLRLVVGERLVAHMRQLGQLKSIIPICAGCKMIRDDDQYWHQVDEYIHEFMGTDFSHGYCPTCADRFRKELLELTGDRG